jgi:two-component system response regulator YesN
MYKLMIVEDEQLARDAIMHSINFAACGFVVAAVCEDGKEAADKYYKLLPDLVITDICMPFVSGLELAGMIAEAGHGTPVIIITGYDDFNFARTAISSHVREYILKPVTSKEFTAILVKYRKILDEQAKDTSRVRSEQKRLYEVTPFARDEAMNRLFQGTVEPQSILCEAQAIGMDTDRKFYAISLLEVENIGEATMTLNVSSELLQFMITNIAEELAEAEPGFSAFSLADGKTAVLGSSDEEDELAKKMKALCAKTRDTIFQALTLPVTIGIGRVAESFSRVHNTYQETLKYLNDKHLIPADSMVSIDEIGQQIHQDPLDSTGDDTERLYMRAASYIKENAARSDLSLMNVCNYLSVSMNYFSAFFHNASGKTFFEYLTEVRMQNAGELLSNTDLQLYVIAEKTGYEDPAYFAAAFRKHSGMSPLEYRRSFQRKE